MSVNAVSAGSTASYASYATSPTGGTSLSQSSSTSMSVGKDGATFSSDSLTMSRSMGSMAEQVMQLLTAALAMQMLCGKDDKDKEDDNSALGLALALGMMGQQQQSTYMSTTSSVSMTPGSYDAAGQAVTTGQTGTMLSTMA